MRVVIAGAGGAGSHLARHLSAGGVHEVVVIESVAARVTALRSSGELEGIRWITGDACEVSTLSRGGLEAVDVIVAVTGDDEDNLVISLLAKQEFGVPRVLARVNDPRNEWLFDDRWGIDVAVSTPQILGALVEEAVSVGTLVRLLRFEGGRTRLSEARLTPSSPAHGRDVAELGLPRDCTVVAVVREDRVIVPRGDTVLRAGDEVLVLATEEVEDEVVAVLLG